jgi:hypothetical protein
MTTPSPGSPNRNPSQPDPSNQSNRGRRWQRFLNAPIVRGLTSRFPPLPEPKSGRGNTRLGDPDADRTGPSGIAQSLQWLRNPSANWVRDREAIARAKDGVRDRARGLGTSRKVRGIRGGFEDYEPVPGMSFAPNPDLRAPKSAKSDPIDDISIDDDIAMNDDMSRDDASSLGPVIEEPSVIEEPLSNPFIRLTSDEFSRRTNSSETLNTIASEARDSDDASDYRPARSVYPGHRPPNEISYPTLIGEEAQALSAEVVQAANDHVGRAPDESEGALSSEVGNTTAVGDSESIGDSESTISVEDVTPDFAENEPDGTLSSAGASRQSLYALQSPTVQDLHSEVGRATSDNESTVSIEGVTPDSGWRPAPYMRRLAPRVSRPPAEHLGGIAEESERLSAMSRRKPVPPLRLSTEIAEGSGIGKERTSDNELGRSREGSPTREQRIANAEASYRQDLAERPRSLERSPQPSESGLEM